MSSKSSRRKSNMENGNHAESETNGATEELKGFATNEVTNAKAVIKDVSVVLTPVPEIENQIAADDEPEKRVTRSKKKENGEKDDAVVENGDDAEVEAEKRVTRSQTKDEDEVVVVETKEEEVVVVNKENGEVFEAEKELEPDETEPELQFEESSDNSGKSSPASRSHTRRSHLRNPPTPKPPVTATPAPPCDDAPQQNDSASFVSSEDLSTQAQPGNDTTRANFEEEPQQPSEFFRSLKDRSYGETLRGLSSRRTISLRSPHVARAEFSAPYPKRASVESVGAGGGVKRKQRSASPVECKRAKTEGGGGLLAYIRSPVFGVRHHFSRGLPSSTPKLTGFRNKNSLLDGEELDKIKLEVEDEQSEKKWCSIM